MSSSACRAERARVVVRVRGMREDDEGMTPRKVRGGGGGASGPSRVRGLWRVVFCACMDQHEFAVRVGLSTHCLLFGLNVETPKTRRCGLETSAKGEHSWGVG